MMTEHDVASEPIQHIKWRNRNCAAKFLVASELERRRIAAFTTPGALIPGVFAFTFYGPSRIARIDAVAYWLSEQLVDVFCTPSFEDFYILVGLPLEAGSGEPARFHVFPARTIRRLLQDGHSSSCGPSGEPAYGACRCFGRVIRVQDEKSRPSTAIQKYENAFWRVRRYLRRAYSQQSMMRRKEK